MVELRHRCRATGAAKPSATERLRSALGVSLNASGRSVRAMANYTATNGSSAGSGTQQATAAAYTGAIVSTTCSTANGGTTTFRRGKWYDILVGTNGAPADNFMEFEVARVTGSSTATFIAAPPLDSADAAHNCLVAVNSSAFSNNITVPNLWYIGMNQRASYRWVCAPGSELVWPATSSNGLTLRQRSGSYTGTATATVMYQEQ